MFSEYTRWSAAGGGLRCNPRPRKLELKSPSRVSRAAASGCGEHPCGVVIFGHAFHFLPGILCGNSSQAEPRLLRLELLIDVRFTRESVQAAGMSAAASTCSPG